MDSLHICPIKKGTNNKTRKWYGSKCQIVITTNRYTIHHSSIKRIKPSKILNETKIKLNDIYIR